MRLPVITDYHTSDLTRPCIRSVYHARLGETSKLITQALYRGIVASGAMEYLHQVQASEWDSIGFIDAAMVFARGKMASELENGRVISPAVEVSEAEHVESVRVSVVRYIDRIGPMLRQCEIIGSELPIHLVFTDSQWLAGEEVEISSHMDALVRDHDGVFGRGREKLIIIDHKMRDEHQAMVNESPAVEYAVRDSQLLVYTLAVRYGVVEITTEYGPVWTEFGEWPEAAVCDLRALRPYSRKTQAKGEDGRVVEYERGDDRPMNRILHWTRSRADREDVIRRQIAERIYAMKIGLYPASPTPAGCRFCPSESWCDRADLSHIQQTQEVMTNG